MQNQLYISYYNLYYLILLINTIIIISCYIFSVGNKKIAEDKAENPKEIYVLQSKT